jgi:hypothetical protein
MSKKKPAKPAAKKKLPVPVESEQRICFGIYWFRTEAEANIYAAAVTEAGLTYNGGWFHGMPCGRDKSFDKEGLFAVTN